MDDDDRIPECDDCTDDGGICNNPHLKNDMCFSLMFKDGFEYYIIGNFSGTYFFFFFNM